MTDFQIGTVRIQSESLSWTSETRTLSGEASELGFGVMPLTIIVESKRTGQTKTFIGLQAVRDAEDEITHWLYKGVNMTLKIFND